MIHFDDVLKTAKEVLAEDPGYASIEEVLVLRDLRGRIRLFLKPKENQSNEVAHQHAVDGALLLHLHPRL